MKSLVRSGERVAVAMAGKHTAPAGERVLSSRGASATKDLEAVAKKLIRREAYAAARRSFVADAPLDDNVPA
jgi:hypothetical protein